MPHRQLAHAIDSHSNSNNHSNSNATTQSSAYLLTGRKSTNQNIHMNVLPTHFSTRYQSTDTPLKHTWGVSSNNTSQGRTDRCGSAAYGTYKVEQTIFTNIQVSIRAVNTANHNTYTQMNTIGLCLQVVSYIFDALPCDPTRFGLCSIIVRRLY
jgi:hypothetical protein